MKTRRTAASTPSPCVPSLRPQAFPARRPRQPASRDPISRSPDTPCPGQDLGPEGDGGLPPGLQRRQRRGGGEPSHPEVPGGKAPGTHGPDLETARRLARWVRPRRRSWPLPSAPSCSARSGPIPRSRPSWRPGWTPWGSCSPTPPSTTAPGRPPFRPRHDERQPHRRADLHRNREALQRLAGIAEAFVTHNRDNPVRATTRWS
jgi:hypothetical protein